MNEPFKVVEKRKKNIPNSPNKKLTKGKYEIVVIVSKPKISHIKLTKEDIENIRKKPIGNELLKFRKKICKNFKSENLNLLNNNIKTVKIKIKRFAPEILSLKFSSGKYSLQKNRIKLIKLFKEGSQIMSSFTWQPLFMIQKSKLDFLGFNNHFIF